MNTKSFSICVSCEHINNCILTDQKEKVWSCSEYDDSNPKEIQIEAIIETRELETIG